MTIRHIHWHKSQRGTTEGICRCGRRKQLAMWFDKTTGTFVVNGGTMKPLTPKK